ETELIATSPTMKQNHWRVAITTTNRFYVGTVEHGHIQLKDEFERVPMPKSTLLDIAKADKNIVAFVYFSLVYRCSTYEYQNITQVSFTDLRDRSKGYYTFITVAQINAKSEITNSYTDWIFSEHKLQKKLYFSENPT